MTYITYFLIYSLLGWCTEVIYATLKTGKFINRGFLNGTWCPIYGCGMVLVLLALGNIDNILLVFIGSIILTTSIEFITGFVLEKFFHNKWWDYSLEPFNIKGYICLKFSLLWGLGVLFILRIVHPTIANLVDLIPNLILTITLVILAIAFIVDLTLTVSQLLKLNQRYKQIDTLSLRLRESSDLIGEKISNVTEITTEKLEELKQRIHSSRLVKAFPNLKIKLEEFKEDLKEKINTIKK